VVAALRAIPEVRELENPEPGSYTLGLDLEGPEAKEGATRAVLRTLLDHGVTPEALHEGASLEARFLELTGGLYDGKSST
jgi:hypothetical protein